MASEIKNFYNLTVWKKAHELTLKIYKATRKFPKDELYGLVSQLRRAVSSIAANIAEGFERYYFKDKIRFYYQARGSAAEVQNFLLLSRDLNFISSEECQTFFTEADEVRRLINSLINAIEKHC